MKKRITVLVLAALLMSLLCPGCMVIKSVDELYAVPKQSSSYYDLDSVIDTAMTGDMQYAAPVSGANQQAVQLADLDGDGSNEALVFVKSSGEKPMKVLIFQKQMGKFQSIATLECSGSSFERVEYIQLDNQPGLELLVGLQVSEQVPHALSVYAFRDGQIVELLNASYAAYTTADLDQDGISELCLLRQDSTGNVATFYDSDTYGNLLQQAEASFSVGSGAIRRLITGSMENGTPAIFVASTYGQPDDGALVTDIFAIRDGTFTNISLQRGTDSSSQTVRNYTVYAADVDADGIIELPRPKKLRTLYGSEDEYWLITWYNMDLDGVVHEKLTTYHNFSGGWFIEVPADWRRSLTISRSQPVAGASGYVFSELRQDSIQAKEIFTIYAFTGEDRNQNATSDGRFLLGEKGDVAYSASFGDSELAQSVSKEELIAWFHYIQVDWNSGEM